MSQTMHDESTAIRRETQLHAAGGALQAALALLADAGERELVLDVLRVRIAVQQRERALQAVGV